MIRDHIPYFDAVRIQKEAYQVRGITVQFPSQPVTLASIYCPPRYRLICENFTNVFSQLGPRFILGGDFNAKHTFWGSGQNNLKGRELLKAITTTNLEVVTSHKPTYWPTDPQKLPDLLDFFVIRGVPTSHIWAENILDLSSDHTPVLLSINSTIVTRPAKQLLYNKSTDWDLFRIIVDFPIAQVLPASIT